MASDFPTKNGLIKDDHFFFDKKAHDSHVFFLTYLSFVFFASDIYGSPREDLPRYLPGLFEGTLGVKFISNQIIFVEIHGV